MEEQVCKKCGKTLPLSDFSKHPSMKNGYLSACKSCKTLYTKNYLEATRSDPGKVARRMRIKRESARRMRLVKNIKLSPEQNNRRCKRYVGRFPEKHAANVCCRPLPKHPGCHLHHWSYNKEHRKDVIELTSSRHYLVHRFMIYDQERMMYRKPDGTLIDSREAAIAYYATLKDE